uniref:Uncharacterized protein n=1 Tax=Rhizophora mucronata TaxID=61149 RepID=A0A2P2NEJ8_RHIMU
MMRVKNLRRQNQQSLYVEFGL